MLRDYEDHCFEHNQHDEKEHDGLRRHAKSDLSEAVIPGQRRSGQTCTDLPPDAGSYHALIL